MRLGFGIDFHQLAPGNPLWIGGVEIPHHQGAVAHSDGDVLLHAVCDAMLGALALGDIGIHFPNTSKEFEKIDSKILLAKCFELISAKGYRVVNVDTTICLENPKIKKHSPAMQTAIAGILQISPDQVSIKATTTEKMGFAGREEGLMAYATVVLQKKISVKIINNSSNPLPAYATSGSAGMDLCANLDAPVTLRSLERQMIPTGLYIELPDGYEAQVRPRSGLAIKQGLTCLNSPGTVDADYRGEIKIILINLSDQPQTINHGERIAQMIVKPVEQISWEAVSELGITQRNQGGFGHTGK